MFERWIVKKKKNNINRQSYSGLLTTHQIRIYKYTCKNQWRLKQIESGSHEKCVHVR